MNVDFFYNWQSSLFWIGGFLISVIIAAVSGEADEERTGFRWRFAGLYLLYFLQSLAVKTNICVPDTVGWGWAIVCSCVCITVFFFQWGLFKYCFMYIYYERNLFMALLAMTIPAALTASVFAGLLIQLIIAGILCIAGESSNKRRPSSDPGFRADSNCNCSNCVYSQNSSVPGYIWCPRHSKNVEPHNRCNNYTS
ncbi:MAG: hypothetical protein LBD59_12545 [Prevotellaceae bacterium]|jgi:hypothetical protein|nr:hypothetical protein [Prevotellaceae bacterium]